MADKNPFASLGLDMLGGELSGLSSSGNGGGPLSILLGGLLQNLGVGSDSGSSEGIAPPTNNMQPISPVMPTNASAPVMPNLQTTPQQSSVVDQAREALKQQIKQSLGIK